MTLFKPFLLSSTLQSAHYQRNFPVHELAKSCRHILDARDSQRVDGIVRVETLLSWNSPFLQKVGSSRHYLGCDERKDLHLRIQVLSIGYLTQNFRKKISLIL